MNYLNFSKHYRFNLCVLKDEKSRYFIMPTYWQKNKANLDQSRARIRAISFRRINHWKNKNNASKIQALALRSTMLNRCIDSMRRTRMTLPLVIQHELCTRLFAYPMRSHKLLT